MSNAPKTVYQIDPASRLSRLDPQAVGERLAKLASYGNLTPERVVEDAQRDPSSPTRAAFEWNDATAAHQFRLAQARRLIRSIIVIEQMGDAPPRELRAFVNVHVDEEQIFEDPGRRYVTTREAVMTPAYRAQVLDRLRAEAHAWAERAAAFEEFAAEVDAIRRGIPDVRPKASITPEPRRGRRRRGEART